MTSSFPEQKIFATDDRDFHGLAASLPAPSDQSGRPCNYFSSKSNSSLDP
jgi:hypothetical protein